MRLTASDLYSYFRPSVCPARVYLREHGMAEADPSPYEQVLLRLGNRHEKAHLATLPVGVDLSAVAARDRAARTISEIEAGTQLVYQGTLRATENLAGVPCEVIGDPDFLIKKGGGYVIRDAKIARRINEKDHPEILLQLNLYGWLYERTFGRAPVGLEVLSGANSVEAVQYDGGRQALARLGDVLALKKAGTEPFSPCGWSKCSGCGFFERCWNLAEERHDVAIIPDVDQGLVTALRGEGVTTIQHLLDRFDEDTLSAFQRPYGARMQKVGKKAETILKQAQALSTGKEIVIGMPAIPEGANYVMFDLEGLPPQMDEADKIYLWGLQVFGNEASAYSPALADFGVDGDRHGWEEFLRNAEGIFKRYGDVPFVHWASYEKARMGTYISRYGDPNGVAARVLGNLLDLLPVTKASVILPLPSYSLKVVERHVGFRRTLTEAKGDWAMAKYIEATETADENVRAGVMLEIQKYNEEDLGAMWTVFEWLKGKAD